MGKDGCLKSSKNRVWVETAKSMVESCGSKNVGWGVYRCESKEGRVEGHGLSFYRGEAPKKSNRSINTWESRFEERNREVRRSKCEVSLPQSGIVIREGRELRKHSHRR